MAIPINKFYGIIIDEAEIRSENTKYMEIFQKDDISNDYNKGYVKMSIRNYDTSRPNQLLACKYCERYYIKLQNMKAHMRMHLGLKPYRCPHCHTYFVQEFNLKRHLANKCEAQHNKVA